MNGEDWLPNLIQLADFNGDWNAYLEAVHKRFMADIVQHTPKYQGLPVKARYHPVTDGKGHGFWHCVSEGLLEHQRTPDLNRCERIAWIRSVIENAHRAEVECWANIRDRQKNHLLWHGEQYLVVLSERKGKFGPYLLLKTAYSTNRAHTQRKLRKERDSP